MLTHTKTSRGLPKTEPPAATRGGNHVDSNNFFDGNTGYHDLIPAQPASQGHRTSAKYIPSLCANEYRLSPEMPAPSTSTAGQAGLQAQFFFLDQQVNNSAAGHERPWSPAVFEDVLIAAAAPLRHCVERGWLRGGSRQH